MLNNPVFKTIWRNLLRGFVRFTGTWLLVIVLVVVLVIFGVKHAWGNFPIVNMHEHVENSYQLDKILNTMDKTGIDHIVLVGSPSQTLYPSRNEGFAKYDANNTELFKIVARTDRVSGFCTISPDDSEHLAKFQFCMEKGISGLKLYSGHLNFYTIPLNDETLDPLYSYVEENKIPVLWHLNGQKYLDEFEDVLTRYPEMKVICPHYCLVSGKRDTLVRLLETYPNLMFDISFGHDDFVKAGFKRITEDIELFRELFREYSDRFLYGTDIVITETKKSEYLKDRFQNYRDFLEKSEFSVNFNGDVQTFMGLDLPRGVLKDVYYRNWEDFIR